MKLTAQLRKRLARCARLPQFLIARRSLFAVRYASTLITTNLRFLMPAFVALIVFLAISACSGDHDRVDMIEAVMDQTPCTHPLDSLALARAALDTIAASYRTRGITTQWTMRRFEPDSAAGIIRVYARPRSHLGGDAVGIVLMNCDGAAFDVILSDTANSPEA